MFSQLDILSFLNFPSWKVSCYCSSLLWSKFSLRSHPIILPLHLFTWRWLIYPPSEITFQSVTKYAHKSVMQFKICIFVCVSLSVDLSKPPIFKCLYWGQKCQHELHQGTNTIFFPIIVNPNFLTLVFKVPRVPISAGHFNYSSFLHKQSFVTCPIQGVLSVGILKIHLNFLKQKRIILVCLHTFVFSHVT